jgi:hypothetical protein
LDAVQERRVFHFIRQNPEQVSVTNGRRGPLTAREFTLNKQELGWTVHFPDCSLQSSGHEFIGH